MLPQWHVRDPGHSAKSRGGRFNLNTDTPLTQQSQRGLSRHSVGTHYENQPTHSLSENTLPDILARWAIVDWSWPKKWNSFVCELISSSKKKKKKKKKQKNAHMGNDSITEPSPKVLASEEKCHQTHYESNRILHSKRRTNNLNTYKHIHIHKAPNHALYQCQVTEEHTWNTDTHRNATPHPLFLAQNNKHATHKYRQTHWHPQKTTIYI